MVASAAQALTFSAALLSLLPALLGLLRALLRCCSLLRGLGACLRRCAAAPFRRADRQDELSACVQEQALRRKVQQLQTMAQLLCFAMSPGTLNIISSLARGKPRWPTPQQDLLACLVQGIMASAVAWPGIINVRTLDWFYSVVTFFLSLSLTPLVLKENVVAMVMATNCAIIPLILSVRKLPQPASSARIAASSALYTVSSVVTVLFPGITTHSVCLALVQATAVFLTGLCAHSLEHFTNQSLQFQEAKELHSAACALLRSFCEVVVELNGDGEIVTRGSDLGSFLLRGASPCLQGYKLVDLIAEEEEKKQFMERLSVPRLKEIGLAENMPVSMRDACSNLIRLELLWFQFTRLGLPHYMVGIREFSDTVCNSPNSIVCSRTGVEEAELTEGALVPAMDWASFSVPETASVASGSLDAPAAMLCLNCEEEGYPILSMTSGFMVRIGRLPMRVRLTKYICNKDEFVSWVQASLNSISHGEERPADCRVKLLMPQGRMCASCRVLARSQQDDRSTEESDSDDTSVVWNKVAVLFFGIGMYASSTPSSPRGGHRKLKGTPSLPMTGHVSL